MTGAGPCPFCGGIPSLLFEIRDENRRASEMRFAYFKCRICRAIFLADPPADLGRYYDSAYYAIPSQRKLEAVANRDRNKIETVLEFVGSGRLLEIGPAFGVFAWQAKKAGFVVDVIEMDTRCCDYLRRVVGVNVIRSDSPHEAMAALPQHEVIAAWHVLEHLRDPLAFLRAAAANLIDGGILAIAVPNPEAWQFRVMGRRWPHLDAPRHLNLIPESLLSRIARELGLERLHLSSDDRDARGWNHFGWQRFLMNRFASRFAQRILFVLGTALALIAAPFDRRDFNGSAYTILFRKTSSP